MQLDKLIYYSYCVVLLVRKYVLTHIQFISDSGVYVLTHIQLISNSRIPVLIHIQLMSESEVSGLTHIQSRAV
jgi:hypothetical protein